MLFRKIAAMTVATGLLLTGSVLGSLASAKPAEAATQIYNPCGWLSEGHVKQPTYMANRITFATATDRSSNRVLITGCVRSGGTNYAQEWQDWGYAGVNGFSAPHEAWEDTWKSPTGSFSFTEALGRSNPGTALNYHTVKWNSKWGGEYGPTYNQYFEGAGGPSDEDLYKYMNQGYYEQAAVINWNRQPDMPTVQGASYAIFFHAGNTTSAGCISTNLSTVNQLLRTNRPGDRIIMGAIDDIFTPWSMYQPGAIMGKFAAAGGHTRVGNPVMNETGLARGAYQNFERSAIYWSPGTNAHLVMGAIRGKWNEQGSENGWMGYPASDEIYNSRTGGVAQVFERGVMYWSPATGAHLSNGAIRSAWGSQGYENGWMGYPTTDEIYNAQKNGVGQAYQRGAIYWSERTGAHYNTGGIRGAYGSQGYENGRLGYPTTNEYASGGKVIQDFEGGRITWTDASGAAISYK